MATLHDTDSTMIRLWQPAHDAGTVSTVPGFGNFGVTVGGD
jgi:hypothetical protein